MNNINELSVDKLSAGELFARELTASKASVDKLSAGEVNANSAVVDDLVVTELRVETINANRVEADHVNTESLKVNYLEATELNVTRLTINGVTVDPRVFWRASLLDDCRGTSPVRSTFQGEGSLNVSEGEDENIPRGEVGSSDSGGGLAEVLSANADAWLALHDEADAWRPVGPMSANSVKPAWARFASPVVVGDLPDFTLRDWPAPVDVQRLVAKLVSAATVSRRKATVFSTCTFSDVVDVSKVRFSKPIEGSPRFARDYVRVDLAAVAATARREGLPFIISGVYVHSQSLTACTFVDIRLFCRGYNARVLCDHLNVTRRTVEAASHTFTDVDSGRRWFLVVEGRDYVDANNVARHGVRLADVNGISVVDARNVTAVNNINLNAFLDVVNYRELRDRHVVNYHPKSAARRVYTATGGAPSSPMLANVAGFSNVSALVASHLSAVNNHSVVDDPVVNRQVVNRRSASRLANASSGRVTPPPRETSKPREFPTLPVSPLDASFDRELTKTKRESAKQLAARRARAKAADRRLRSGKGDLKPCRRGR